MMKLSSDVTFNPRRRQSAQAMVEFALVLPILLLVILGLIGFGHLLFTYSLITAASREAARYGVATGLSDRNIPRFRDCDDIRAAAMRVGAVAGVREDAISIAYDKGPHSDGSPADPVTPVADCPVGGIGPGNINIGNRIVVSVDVNYHSIVPLGVIPDFTISAVTRRTIINTLPIDDAPVAPGSQCVGTILRVYPPNWVAGQTNSTSIVGEPVQFGAEVIADNPSVKSPGTLNIYIDDATYTTAYCTGTTGGTVSTLTCTAKTWDATGMGEHWIRAMYDPGSYATGTPCYNTSKAEPWQHLVGPADSVISQFTTEDQSYKDLVTQQIINKVGISIEVQPVAPGSGAPVGPVVLMEGDKVIGTLDVTAVAGYPNVARGTIQITLPDTAAHTITAIYGPGTGYNISPPVSVVYPALTTSP